MSHHLNPEHAYNYIELDEKNRIVAEYDFDGSEPYDEGAMPVFEIAYTGYRGGHTATAMNDTAKDFLDCINAFLDRHGYDFDLLERYVKIFHGATQLIFRTTQANDIICFDPQKVVDVGWTDTPDTRGRAIEGALDEWQAWVDNEIFWIRHERYVTGRRVYDDGRPDEPFGEWEVGESVSGYYGHEQVTDEALKAWALENTDWSE